MNHSDELFMHSQDRTAGHNIPQQNLAPQGYSPQGYSPQSQSPGYYAPVGSSPQSSSGVQWAEAGQMEKAPYASEERRICGLRSKIAMIAMLVIAVIIIAVTVGVAVPLSKKNNNSAAVAQNDASATTSSFTSSISTVSSVTSTSSTSSTTSSSSSESSKSTSSSTTSSATSTHSSSTTTRSSSTSKSSSTATAVATAIKIASAFYGGQDVTNAAASTFEKDGKLVIDTADLNTGLSDPWPNQLKCLAILHSVGTVGRTFVACEGQGSFELSPEDLASNSNVNTVLGEGGSASFAIISVVWGAAEIRDKAVYDTLYAAQSKKSKMPWANELFGKDTMENQAKSGVIWYSTDGGNTVKGVGGREGDEFSFT